MPEESVNRLYTNLKSEGFKLGTLEDFYSNLQDEDKRRRFYENMSSNGYKFGDYEVFSSKVAKKTLWGKAADFFGDERTKPKKTLRKPSRTISSYELAGDIPPGRDVGQFGTTFTPYSPIQEKSVAEYQDPIMQAAESIAIQNQEKLDRDNFLIQNPDLFDKVKATEKKLGSESTAVKNAVLQSVMQPKKQPGVVHTERKYVPEGRFGIGAIKRPKAEKKKRIHVGQYRGGSGFGMGGLKQPKKETAYDYTVEDLNKSLERKAKEEELQSMGQTLAGLEEEFKQFSQDTETGKYIITSPEQAQLFDDVLNRYNQTKENFERNRVEYDQLSVKDESEGTKEHPKNIDPNVIKQLNEIGAIKDGYYFYNALTNEIIDDPQIVEELDNPQTPFNENFKRPWYYQKVDVNTGELSDEDRIDVGDITAIDIITKPVPFVGGFPELYDVGKVGFIWRDLDSGKKVSDEDMIYLRDYLDEMMRERSFWYGTVSGLLQAPAFIGEMALTGGFYTFGKKAGKESFKYFLKKALTKKGRHLIETELAKRGLTWAGRATGVAVQTAVMTPFRIATETVQKMTPTGIVTKTPEGWEVSGREEGKGFWESFGRAVVNNIIEVGTERSGIFLGRFGSGVKNKIMGRAWASAAEKANKLPEGTIGKILRKGQFSGFFSEMGEEELGRIMRMSTGLDEWKMPTVEELAQEVIIIGSISGLGKLTETYNRKKYQKARNKFEQVLKKESKPETLNDKELKMALGTYTKDELTELGFFDSPLGLGDPALNEKLYENAKVNHQKFMNDIIIDYANGTPQERLQIMGQYGGDSRSDISLTDFAKSFDILIDEENKTVENEGFHPDLYKALEGAYKDWQNGVDDVNVNVMSFTNTGVAQESMNAVVNTFNNKQELDITLKYLHQESQTLSGLIKTVRRELEYARQITNNEDEIAELENDLNELQTYKTSVVRAINTIQGTIPKIEKTGDRFQILRDELNVFRNQTLQLSSVPTTQKGGIEPSPPPEEKKIRIEGLPEKEAPEKAYRVPTGFVAEGSAGDVVRYEQEALGNELGVSEDIIQELDKYPASQIHWFTRTKEQAERYGKDVTETELPAGSRIIADIGDEGILVLTPQQKPAVKVAETTQEAVSPVKRVEVPITGEKVLEKPKILFRGETPGEIGMDLFGGIGQFWTTDRKIAEGFGKIKEFVIPEDWKTLDLTKGEGKDILREITGDDNLYNELQSGEQEETLSNNKEIFPKLKEIGYDAVRFANIEGKADYVLSKPAVKRVKKIKTKPEKEQVIEKEKPAKQPWEMTREEWRNNPDMRAEGYSKKEYRKYGIGGKVEKSINNAIDTGHRLYIEKALSEGKPVPEEVLRDYPDLKPNKTLKKPRSKEDIKVLENMAVKKSGSKKDVRPIGWINVKTGQENLNTPIGLKTINEAEQVGATHVVFDNQYGDVVEIPLKEAKEYWAKREPDLKQKKILKKQPKKTLKKPEKKNIPQKYKKGKAVNLRYDEGRGIVSAYSSATGEYLINDKWGNTITVSGRKNRQLRWFKESELSGLASGLKRYSDDIKTIPKEKRAEVREKALEFKKLLNDPETIDTIIGEDAPHVYDRYGKAGMKDFVSDIVKQELVLGDISLPTVRAKSLGELKEYIRKLKSGEEKNYSEKDRESDVEFFGSYGVKVDKVEPVQETIPQELNDEWDGLIEEEKREQEREGRPGDVTEVSGMVKRGDIDTETEKAAQRAKDEGDKTSKILDTSGAVKTSIEILEKERQKTKKRLSKLESLLQEESQKSLFGSKADQENLFLDPTRELRQEAESTRRRLTDIDAQITELKQRQTDLEAVERGKGAGELFEKPSSTKPVFSPNDVDYKLAYSAYAGTSFSPERRAKQRQQDYVNHMEGLYSNLKKYANTLEKQAILNEEIQKYKEGYLKRLNTALSADSRTFSSMITGPANFPTKSNQKKLDTARKRWEELFDWQDKAKNAIRRKLTPEKQPISSDDPNAIQKLEEKIIALEKTRETMKAANKIVRNKKLSNEEKLYQLNNIDGLTEKAAKELLEPDFAGRYGFASYALSNNSTNIRRMKDRITELKANREAGTVEQEIKGVRVVENVEDNRLQLFFDGKPSDKIRSELKARGFRWAPSVEAWQRQLTNNARMAKNRILDLLDIDESEIQEQRTSPTERATAEWNRQAEAILSKAVEGISVVWLPNTLYQRHAINDFAKQGIAFFDPVTNQITVNKDKATKDTIFHEFSHPVVNHIRKSNTKLYDQGLDLIKGTEYEANTKAQGYEDYRDEALVQAIGEEGARILEEKQKNRFKIWLKRLMFSVRKIFGKVFGISPTLSEFTSAIAYKMQKEKPFIDAKFSKDEMIFQVNKPKPGEIISDSYGFEKLVIDLKYSKNWIHNIKPVIKIKNDGIVSVLWDKGFKKKRDLHDKIYEVVTREFEPPKKEGVFFRFTKNKNELELAKKGELKSSWNYADNKREKGVSVADHPGYGMSGYKYGYKVKGEIIGYGSDDETLLDPKTIKPIQDTIFTASELVSKEGEKRRKYLYKSLSERGWTIEQYKAVLEGIDFPSHPESGYIQLGGMQYQKASQNQPSFVNQMAKIYKELGEPTKPEFMKFLREGDFTKKDVKRASMLYTQIKDKQLIDESGIPTKLEKEMKRLEKTTTEEKLELDEVKKLQTRIEDKIKLLIRGHRIGMKEKHLELVKLKRMIRLYAKKNLPQNEITRGQITPLLTAMERAKDIRGVKGAYRRIDKIANTVYKKKVKRAIASMLKKSQPKKLKGKPVGKLTANVHKEINNIFTFVAGIESVAKEEGVSAREKARDRMAEILSGVESGIKDDSPGREMTDEESREMYLLGFVGIKEMSLKELMNVHDELESLIKTGRTLWAIKTQARREFVRGAIGQFLNVITGKRGLLSEAKARQLGMDKKTGMIKDFFYLQNQSFEWLLDIVSKLDKDSDPLNSRLNRFFVPRILKARKTETRMLRNLRQDITGKLLEIYETKSNRQLMNIVKKNSEKVDTGIQIVEESGEIVDLKMSQNEAYKKWMEWQDPTLRPTFEKMGYTEDTINELYEFISPEIREWARWQLEEFYPGFYNEVNKVYREKFNVDLPFNEFYSPISRNISKPGEDDPLLQRQGSYATVLNQHLKSRVNNTNELKLLDGDSVLMNHIVEMSHFIAFSEISGDLRSIMGSNQIQKAIGQYHSTNVRRVINHHINDIIRGGVDRSKLVSIMDKQRGNFVKYAIGMNVLLFPKQLMSFPAYAADLPAGELRKGLWDFIRNPGKAIKTLSKSELIKDRYEAGWERDVKVAMEKTQFQQLAGISSITDLFLLTSRLGDKAAILLGGWSVYKYHYENSLKKGLSEQRSRAKAMQEFELATDRSQQSAKVESLGHLQRLGSVAKLFTMFMTAQSSYFRREIGAIRNLIAKRGKVKDHIRTIAIYHVLLPTMFQWVANLFSVDDDEKRKKLFRAAILGSFNGLMIVGDLGEYLLDVIWASKQSYYGWEPVPSADPLKYTAVNVVTETIEIVDAIRDGDEDVMNEVWDAVDALADFGGALAGVPYGNIKRMVTSWYDYATGKEKDIRRPLFGVSKYAIYGSSSDKQILLRRSIKEGLDEDFYMEELKKQYLGSGKTEKSFNMSRKLLQKEYRIFKEFGFDNRYVNKLLHKYRNNDERKAYLGRLRKKMGDTEFWKFYDRALTTGLISKELNEMFMGKGGRIGKRLKFPKAGLSMKRFSFYR